MTAVTFEEPKMETFRKVRAGWYTLAVVHWRDALDQVGRVPEHERSKELWVDVSKYGDEWMVSVRGADMGRRDMTLDQHSQFAQPLYSLSDARRYAVTLKAYLSDKGSNPDPWLLNKFAAERDARHRAEIEATVGEPYAEWEAEMNARYSK